MYKLNDWLIKVLNDTILNWIIKLIKWLKRRTVSDSCICSGTSSGASPHPRRVSLITLILNIVYWNSFRKWRYFLDPKLGVKEDLCIEHLFYGLIKTCDTDLSTFC